MNIYNSHAPYVEFWKTLVSSFIPIGHSEEEPHFTRIIDTTGSPFEPYYMTQEFKEKLPHDLKAPYFLLESFREKLSGGRSSKSSTYDCGFIILNQTGQVKDFDSINQVIDQTELWAHQILGKADNEMQIDDSLSKIDWDSVVIHKVGPVQQSLFGVRVDFKVIRQSTQKYCVDDNLWG